MKPQRAERVAGFAVGGTRARRVHRHLPLLLFTFSRTSVTHSLTQEPQPINIAFLRPNWGRGRSLHHSRLGLGWGTILPPPLIHSVLRGQSSNGSGGAAAAWQQAGSSSFHLSASIQHCSTVEAGSSEVRPTDRREERWNFTTSP